jgi:hypothetical protein
MTEYIDTAELARRIPDDDPRKARLLWANELARLNAEESAVDELTAQFIPGALDAAEEMDAGPGVSDDEQLRRVQKRLRSLFLEMQSTPEDSPKMAELKKKYRELMKRLRELGGDAPLKDSYPGDDLTEADVDRIVADWTGGGASPVVDLSEQEKPDQEDRGDAPSSGYFDTEALLRIAQEDDGPPTDEEELHEALRRQEIADRFGSDPGDALTDEEIWAELTRSWGLEEK